MSVASGAAGQLSHGYATPAFPVPVACAAGCSEIVLFEDAPPEPPLLTIGASLGVALCTAKLLAESVLSVCTFVVGALVVDRVAAKIVKTIMASVSASEYREIERKAFLFMLSL